MLNRGAGLGKPLTIAGRTCRMNEYFFTPTSLLQSLLRFMCDQEGQKILITLFLFVCISMNFSVRAGTISKQGGSAP